jgi:hypothetical protein
MARLKTKKRRRQPSQTGCFFLLTTGLVLIGLLIINSMFVRTFFGANYIRIDQRVFGAMQFILPIVLIFIEFWIYDAVVDFFRYRKLDRLNDDDLGENR